MIPSACPSISGRLLRRRVELPPRWHEWASRPASGITTDQDTVLPRLPSGLIQVAIVCCLLNASSREDNGMASKCCGMIVHVRPMRICTRVRILRFEYKYGVELLLSFTSLSIKHSAPIQHILTSLQSFFATSIATHSAPQSRSNFHLPYPRPKHTAPIEHR